MRTSQLIRMAAVPEPVPYVAQDDFDRRDDVAALIEEWHAPRIDDAIVDVLGVIYRQKSRRFRELVSFAAFLMARGY